MEAMVIKPRPPICISERMTSLPNRVNTSPVFTTVRPVTQTAEVAVNSASIKVMSVPSFTVAKGMHSRPAPIKTTDKNPSVRI